MKNIVKMLQSDSSMRIEMRQCIDEVRCRPCKVKLIDIKKGRFWWPFSRRAEDCEECVKVRSVAGWIDLEDRESVRKFMTLLSQGEGLYDAILQVEHFFQGNRTPEEYAFKRFMDEFDGAACLDVFDEDALISETQISQFTNQEFTLYEGLDYELSEDLHTWRKRGDDEWNPWDFEEEHERYLYVDNWVSVGYRRIGLKNIKAVKGGMTSSDFDISYDHFRWIKHRISGCDDIYVNGYPFTENELREAAKAWKDGAPIQFYPYNIAWVPPYIRKTRSLEAALPWLYLKGISTGEMGEALKMLVGNYTEGLSASTISRLKQVWAEQYIEWRSRPLHQDQWAYIWADGIYSVLRSEQDKLCTLVIVGVNERGEKHFLAIEDGVRESTQSWREVLLQLKNRGMNIPQLAIGDGAMGFWSAMDDVYPDTRHQCCWVHKTANILKRILPKTSQLKAKKALREIWQAETKTNAENAFDLFIESYDAKYPTATVSLQKDREELLTFYDFPAMHWQSIRTSNPIESTFGTIRHRTKRSREHLSREEMLHMMFKLSQCAEKRWRRLRGFDHLAKVIEGVKFRDGVEVISDNRKED